MTLFKVTTADTRSATGILALYLNIETGKMHNSRFPVYANSEALLMTSQLTLDTREGFRLISVHADLDDGSEVELYSVADDIEDSRYLFAMLSDGRDTYTFYRDEGISLVVSDLDSTEDEDEDFDNRQLFSNAEAIAMRDQLIENGFLHKPAYRR